MSEASSSTSDLVRVHVIVHGTVQGVAFRAYTQHQAQRLNLHGWVKNLPTGQVETEVEGERGAVKTFLGCIEKGPPLAHVMKIDLDWIPVIHDVSPFCIRR